MLNYGSKTDLPKLMKSDVGRLYIPKPEHHGGFNFWNIFKIIVDVVEVALTFIPGVGTLAQTAIAVAASAIRLGVDAGQGQLNPLSVGLDVASTLIPGATHAIGNAVNVGKFASGVEKYAIESTEKFSASLGKNGDLSLKTLLEGTTFTNKGKSVIQLGAFEGEKFSKFKGLDSQIKKIWEKSGYGLAEHVDKNLLKSLKSAAGTYGKNATKVAQGIGELGEEIGEESYTIANKLSQATELELLELARTMLNITERELEALKEAFKNSITRKEIFDALEKRFGKASIRKLASKGFFAKLPKSNAIEEAELTAEVLGKEVKQIGKTNRFIKALKNPASAEFNDLVVQKVQMIFDPNDLGRAPVEMAYQALKKQIRKVFKKLDKYMMRAEKIDEIFEKSGGILVNSNVIVGYKVIHSKMGHHSVIINFYPEATKATHYMWRGRVSNNLGGKKPVLVRATTLQLKRLRDEGMAYYLKKWAYSRGGAPIGANLFGQIAKALGASSVLLPFINTGLLRNMLSLSSNIIGNAKKMSQGQWFETWFENFKGSFSRSWKNRSGRLFGRAIIGGLAGSFAIGKFGKKIGMRIGAIVGKESQRFMSMITTSYIKAKSLKTGSFLENFGRAFKKQIGTRFATSIRGHVKSSARRRGYGSTIIGSMGAKRKLGFVARIPSSITGGTLNRRKLAIKL